MAGLPLTLASSAQRPNILLVLTDDQRADALGCAGNSILRTPNMDTLARTGVRFRQAFAASPICAASRASVLTGLHERGHRYTFGTAPLAKDLVRASYPSTMRRAGYRTGFVGKLGVDVGPGSAREMFDVFHHLEQPPYFRDVAGRRRHLSQIIADHAVDFLGTNPKGQPFCLSVSFSAPHAVDDDPRQFFWPESCDDLYRDAEIPVPGPEADGIFRSQPDFVRNSLGRRRWAWRFDTPARYREMVRGYYRMITGVDMELGRLLGELDRLRMRENTIVIFSSDNGYFLGERGLAGKWLLYEPSIRVPLIISDPRLSPLSLGRVRDELALNVDIAPTILGLAGIAQEGGVHGRSLGPLLGTKAVPWREEVFLEHLYDHPEIPSSEGVRTSRWKYIRYRREPAWEELYDLERDPAEAVNLAGSGAEDERLARMRARCDHLSGDYGDLHSS
ncbi:MAG: sulfatase [bacterium]|nr:MAG: sulfatase [bacterium]